ncbi:OLC1v1014094C1 [Oldenlandia corymbosa var. corymbosa]|uniref:OLC1v1014094C1 n=1 Tax=Oldenlandia corymbosa var. corymbosa TaxID=529605 RepID=A0AAV1DZW9_OLDCO|nr:OLC1v1014094C1 [Oldenlandia corymbosa var. corymbosa]
MYDPIFAKSFSKYEQKRFGCWAILICMIMVVTICMEFKPNFHPLSLIGNALNLQLSINGAQDMIVTKVDKGISSPSSERKSEMVKATNNTSEAVLDETHDVLSPSATEEAKEVEPIHNVTIKDKSIHPPILETEAKEVEPPPKESITKDHGIPSHLEHQHNEAQPTCNFLGPLSDYCEMEGDIRIEPKSNTIFFVAPKNHVKKIDGNHNNSWTIQPYARKGNLDAMVSVKKWTIRLAGHDYGGKIPNCNQIHTTPAILFSTGGFSGNPFHDFADLLVPVFATSREFNGQVQFLVTDYENWWISKYKMFFSGLSRHPIIPIDEEKEMIHCYPRIVLGLKSHKEFDIDSSKSPNGLSMNHFREFLRNTYSLERTKAIRLKKGDGQKPRLMLISRMKTRLITNVDAIARMVRKSGYEVVVAEARISTNLTAFAQLVNSCDVLMGVHGAGLTNMVFLPDNAVLIQIIPFGGIDGYARNDFGKPSTDMNINYLEYKIKVTESSLIQQYPPDHDVFRDPISIHKQGWGAIRSIYLDKQDVRIDLRRFRSTLAKAIKDRMTNKSTLLARTFSRREHRRLGWWAFVIFLIIGAASILDIIVKPHVSSPVAVSNLRLSMRAELKMHFRTKEKTEPRQPYYKTREAISTCDFTKARSDICEMTGDIRVHGNSSTVFFIGSFHNEMLNGSQNSWYLKPYARKTDRAAMESVRLITIKTGQASEGKIPFECSRNYSIPGIVFSTGGYAGNQFHDFADVLIPLYLTSIQFNGEVQLLLTDKRSWWNDKHQKLLQTLSNYELIDMDSTSEVLCFSKIIIGLNATDKQLGVDPSQSSHSMKSFRKLVRSAYSLKRESAINATNGCRKTGKKPKLLLISRNKTRRLINAEEISATAKSLGFDVVVQETGSSETEVSKFVNSFDVLVGVHGAGLTNMVYLPDNALVIQIVLLGEMEWMAKTFYEDPARDMNLNYLEYKISPNESSLIQQYPNDHEVFRDPGSIKKRGWLHFKSIFMDKQDIKLDLNRLLKVWRNQQVKQRLLFALVNAVVYSIWNEKNNRKLKQQEKNPETRYKEIQAVLTTRLHYFSQNSKKLNVSFYRKLGRDL